MATQEELDAVILHIIELSRAAISTGKVRKITWPAVRPRGMIIGRARDEVREWASANLRDAWIEQNGIFFIKDKQDLAWFRLKWA